MGIVFNSSGFSREQMENLYRNNLIVCDDLELEVATIPNWAIEYATPYLKKPISGAETCDSILPTNKVEVSRRNAYIYPKLYKTICKGMDARDYILSHWSEYDMVDSREEMIGLLNILEAHGENLDSLRDVVVGNTDWLCGIWMNSGPTTDREVVKILHEFNVFYADKDKALEAFKEDAECTDMSFDEFVNWEDIRSTLDGVVRILYY